MVVTSPRLSFFVLARDPGDRAAAGGVRPAGAAALAHRAGHARRCLGLCGRADRRDAHAAGLHQRGAGAIALRRRGRARFRGGAAIRRARARCSPRSSSSWCSRSVVVILWVGAQDVLAGRTTPGTLGQFVLYAVFAASGLGQLSEVWGELSQASGAAERLTELLAVEPEIKAPPHPVALPAPRARRGRIRGRALCLSDAAGRVRARRRVVPRAAGREGRDRRAVGRRQEHDLPSAAALLRSARRARHVRRRARARCRSARRCAAASRWCRRTWRSSPPAIADNIRFGRPDATRRRDRARRRARGCGRIHRRGCRRATTRRSASAASRCRAGSASASRSRARSCATRRCCCSTRRPRRSMPRARRWCRPRSTRLMQGRTTLVIAHRLATVLSCDRILVLDQRPHRRAGHARSSLAAAGGLYARLASCSSRRGDNPAGPR